MSQLGIIYKKEMIEMWRNYKWLWIPLVFILFGIMQPISTYYMPEIIDKLGGLPEGTVIDIPMPTGPEMMAKTMSQLNLIGVLILVLSFMGIVSSEIERGVAGMIMLKPVKFHNFIVGKWLSALTLTILSLGLGIISAWYYTDILIGSVNGQYLLNSFGVFSVWFSVVISITLFFSTIIRSNGGIAAVSILLIVALSFLPNIAPKLLKYSPGALSNYAYQIMLLGESNSGLFVTLCITVSAIIALLLGAIFLFRSTFHITS